LTSFHVSSTRVDEATLAANAPGVAGALADGSSASMLLRFSRPPVATSRSALLPSPFGSFSDASTFTPPSSAPFTSAAEPVGLRLQASAAAPATCGAAMDVPLLYLYPPPIARL
jgi:hypothetical protein